MAYIIKTDGRVIETEPKNKVTFTLQELRQGIGGGYIEMVRACRDHNNLKHKNSSLIVDEEGLLKDLKYNAVASAIAEQPICGDAMLVQNNQLQ